MWSHAAPSGRRPDASCQLNCNSGSLSQSGRLCSARVSLPVCLLVVMEELISEEQFQLVNTWIRSNQEPQDDEQKRIAEFAVYFSTYFYSMMSYVTDFTSRLPDIVRSLMSLLPLAILYQQECSAILQACIAQEYCFKKTYHHQRAALKLILLSWV